MLNIERHVFNPFGENTYLIWDDISGEGAVIDPGCSNVRECGILADAIERHKVKVKYLLNTHEHIDHIVGNSFIKDKYGAEYLCHSDDLFLLDEINNSPAAFGMEDTGKIFPDRLITEQTILGIGELKLEFMHTPGHSPGSVCIYIREYNTCFTGDLLFRGSVGRTDLWRGDSEILFRSIEEKILCLPDDTAIYPGHGQSSSIGEEKHLNPFLT